MPLGLNFGGAQTGFDTFASLQGGGSSAEFNNAGSSSSVIGQALQVGQFGLDVFNAVSGRNIPTTAAPIAPVTSSSVVPVPSNFSPIQNVPFSPGQGGGFQNTAAMVPSIVSAARIGVAFVLRKIKANTGLRITTKKIVSAIRQFGPSSVAVWAGVSMAELMIVWDRGSRRVKRRFTKRDRSRGRSYIRHLKRQADELKDLGCGPKPRARRKC